MLVRGEFIFLLSNTKKIYLSFAYLFIPYTLPHVNFVMLFDIVIFFTLSHEIDLIDLPKRKQNKSKANNNISEKEKN